MTPFQETLYRLLQDSRKESNAFTSLEEDSGNDLQKIVAFSKEWDFKSKYDLLSKEHESLKHRSEKEKLVIAKKATQYVIKELVPIIDQLFILQNNVEKNSPQDKGLQLIIENLEQILVRRKGGIIRPQVGDELDPQKHKAIAAEEVPNQRGTVVSEVYRYGYQVLGAIVREAEVKVRCGIKGV